MDRNTRSAQSTNAATNRYHDATQPLRDGPMERISHNPESAAAKPSKVPPPHRFPERMK
jgi:hypothetical protein